MAQQIIPAAQIVSKFQGIRRCNNYVVLQSIICSPECKIVGHILLNHPLSYALTATADVPAVYLQQFWKTVSKVPNTKGTTRITPSAHRSPTLTAASPQKKRKQIAEETSSPRKSLKPGSYKENPEHVDDDDDENEKEKKHKKKDDVEDKDNADHTDHALGLTDTASPSTATTSKDPYKKRHISSKYNHLSRALPQDVQTSRIYDQGYGKKMCDNWRILEKMMLFTPDIMMTIMTVTLLPRGRKERKDTRHPKVESLIGVLRQNNHLKNPYLMYLSNNRNEVHELRKQLLMKMRIKKDNDDYTHHLLVGTYATGSMETRNEQMQTPIPTPNRSPRKDLSSDKTILEELTAPVSPTTTTTSKSKSKRGFTFNKTKILSGSIAGMCRRRGQIHTHLKTKFLTHEFFMGMIREVLDHCNNVVPEMTIAKTNELIKEEMP
ncbi:hypothetical protein Tco_0944020 [Tanacetum coccineum]